MNNVAVKTENRVFGKEAPGWDEAGFVAILGRMLENTLWLRMFPVGKKGNSKCKRSLRLSVEGKQKAKRG